MENSYIGTKPYPNGNLNKIFTKKVMKDGKIYYICPDIIQMFDEEQIKGI